MPPSGDDDLAEHEAGRLFQRHLERLARRPPIVFISCAREDAEWVERLRAKLAPLIVDKGVTVWDDSYIRAGTSWDAAIHDAIFRAHVAVLIVSRHFLASSYSVGTELALVRERAKAERVRLYWISIDGSRPDPQEQRLQAAHDPSEPLAYLDQAAADQVLREFAGPLEGDFRRSD